MRRARLIVVTMVALLAVANTVRADTILFANLTNSQEPGPVIPTTTLGALRPVSFGSGTFVLNDARTALTMNVTIFNIDVTGTQTPDTNDNLVAAHIHVGLDPAAPTFPVRWGFFGAPDNDVSPDNLVVTPFAERCRRDLHQHLGSARG